ncbi:transglutaminase-like domain-containing protein [Gelidibacter sp. F63206]|uniref:transglutaminase-like domain-containing protein n=1 Tax=Gelidibacter sp. F63206 TaxID=2926425 RepID=UPI001FF48F14|nr:transglutaminase-like domain-containing protein [Gelidibacter sp. F63206]MCK0114743.1 transglutaminase-like domain-containing protein [Gelidibacter sp. F63206]
MTYLEENYNFDYSSQNIQNIIKKISEDSSKDTSLDFAIKAYYYIRDAWPYNPYRISLKPNDWRASKISTHTTGHCLDKAVLLISVLRAKNIPARLGLAKVKNHIAVDDIIEKFGNDVLVPHGYVELYLNGKWVKATPAFNKSLCEKMNVAPLDFDGTTDSLFQAYDSSGTSVFMEYLEDYGTFDHVPLTYMFDLMKDTYPPLRENKIEIGMVLNLKDL